MVRSGGHYGIGPPSVNATAWSDRETSRKAGPLANSESRSISRSASIYAATVNCLINPLNVAGQYRARRSTAVS
jgi:hypothetical protein